MQLWSGKAVIFYMKGYNINFQKIEKFRVYRLILMSTIHTDNNSAKSYSKKETDKLKWNSKKRLINPKEGRKRGTEKFFKRWNKQKIAK